MPRLKKLAVMSFLAASLCTSSLAFAQGTQRSVNDDLLYRISFGRVEDVQGLLDKGAEPNIYGNMGDTPLILSITRTQRDADDMVKALLAKGADPNFPDKNGIYPLEVAIKNNRAPIIQILIDGGADIHMKTQSGMTMVDLASKLGKEDVNKIMADQLKKESEMEAQMHDPTRLLSLIHQFSTSVCEMTYWNNYLYSEQNPKDNDSSREKLAKSKDIGEKVGREIATYFPKVKLDSYIKFATTSITNVFKSMPDNKTRAEQGIGSDEDAHKRCAPVADSSRQSIAAVLEAQKQAEADAARQAELQR